MADFTLTQQALVNDFSRLFANMAAQRVRRFVESTTLRDALRVERVGGKWFVGVPHYWAVYYHDGRRAAQSNRDNGFLVWYKNPQDDPRHGGTFPVRASQLRSLKQAGISLERLRADIDSGRAVIARYSPRSRRRVAGKPFFKQGLTGFFRSGVRQLATAEFRKKLRAALPKEAFVYTKQTLYVSI